MQLSFWELVLRDVGPQLNEQIKDLLELSEDVQTPRVVLTKVPSLFERCCEVLCQDGVAVHKQVKLSRELRDAYVVNYEGAQRKQDVSENVRYQVLFALDLFDMLMLMNTIRRRFRIYSKRQWKSLWGFQATLYFSTTIAHQAVFMDMLWKSLHNQLNLPPVQQAIMERHVGYWIHYSLTHIDGHVFNLTPYIESYPINPENLTLGRRQVSRRIYRAIELHQCTFDVTGISYRFVQPQWICLTCGMGVENNLFICHSCALTCHRGHKLVFRGLWTGFCDSLEG